MSLAKRIRSARIARDLSQAQLAELMKVTRSAISQWELAHGATIPRGHRLERLAVILGVTVEWLTTGREARRSLATADDSGGYRRALTDDERTLLDGYSRLDTTARTALLVLLKSMGNRRR